MKWTEKIWEFLVNFIVNKNNILYIQAAETENRKTNKYELIKNVITCFL